MNLKLLIMGAFLILGSCTGSERNTEKREGSNSRSLNMETAIEDREWIYLFDGHSLEGWHGYNKSGPIMNWKIEDSALVCLGKAEVDIGGDIVTDAEFENFELVWDWKIDSGSNSGVLYHVVESPEYRAPWATGPEYQMFDDSIDNRHESEPGSPDFTHQTGSNYGMYGPMKKPNTKPVGEWNTSKIIVMNDHTEFWLNGEKILEFVSGSEEWQALKESGKWKDYPDYGMASRGKIALQDHGNKAYFKNIKIRNL